MEANNIRTVNTRFILAVVSKDLFLGFSKFHFKHVTFLFAFSELIEKVGSLFTIYFNSHMKDIVSLDREMFLPCFELASTIAAKQKVG